ncbi:HEAT repeat domain-containing protein [Oligoflexus tunisiensis]|uniref:HEAT repeat domain-containing protein n=1 Tax=Oligoflexus tunisiensis TaxID=708132 RepID=UPI00114CBD89|nr:HEAT repeat domain-containing protein [Oligoflexus tunisiensis]
MALNSKNKKLEKLLSLWNSEKKSVKHRAGFNLITLDVCPTSTLLEILEYSLIDRMNTQPEIGAYQISRILKEKKDPIMFDLMMEYCKRKDQVYREIGAELLGILRDNRAIETLVSLLEDEWPLVRRAAICSLGELKEHPGVIEKLRSHYELRKEEINVTLALERILGPILLS